MALLGGELEMPGPHVPREKYRSKLGKPAKRSEGKNAMGYERVIEKFVGQNRPTG